MKSVFNHITNMFVQRSCATGVSPIGLDNVHVRQGLAQSTWTTFRGRPALALHWHCLGIPLALSLPRHCFTFALALFCNQWRSIGINRNCMKTMETIETYRNQLKSQIHENKYIFNHAMVHLLSQLLLIERFY